MAITAYRQTNDADHKQTIKDEIIRHLSGQERDEKKAKVYIDDYVMKRGHHLGLDVSACVQLSDEIFNAMFRLDLIQPFVEDTQVNEIMVNGLAPIIIERNGRIEVTDVCFKNTDALMNLINKIVSQVNRKVNQSNPIVDARLSDGSRVHVVLSPVALNGPILTIRKFNEHSHTIESLLAEEPNADMIGAFLKHLVSKKYNIFISGGTSSGKTTFLNALSTFIPKHERIITIEDSAEIALHQVTNLVRLETKQFSDGSGIDMNDLIIASLRMRPDRIIVGEVRGKEALEMINAMNTGHDGSLSTGHANSAEDMLKRLELMILKGMELSREVMMKLLSSSLDIIIHLARDPQGGRQIVEIVEVLPARSDYILNVLYTRVDKELKKVGELCYEKNLE